MEMSKISRKSLRCGNKKNTVARNTTTWLPRMRAVLPWRCGRGSRLTRGREGLRWTAGEAPGERGPTELKREKSTKDEFHRQR